MTDVEFMKLCKEEVKNYTINHCDKTDATPNIDVCVVWYCKTLQNWKALLSTTNTDGMYYECTFNGDKNELYLDAYKKFENVCIPQE